MGRDTIFFLSDVHLGVDSPSRERLKERNLISFLEHVKAAGETLFILGDLFDVWFEYRKVIPSRYFRVLYFLQDVLESGVKVHYILGNHDFWANDGFFQSMGMVLHRRPFQIGMRGRNYYLSHGDDPGYHDRGYRVLKRVIRNRAVIWTMGLLHPDLGLSLAERISRLSRKHPRGKTGIAYERYIANVAGPVFDKGADVVIIGHIHTPYLKKMDGKVFVNIGNWFRDFTYGRLDPEGEIHLERWTHPS